jgi:hypothetical protein
MIVATSIASLKVAVMAVFVATPGALSTGTVALTVGGVVSPVAAGVQAIKTPAKSAAVKTPKMIFFILFSPSIYQVRFPSFMARGEGAENFRPSLVKKPFRVPMAA